MNNVTRLAKLLASSEKTVFFTGAGISTESGIPDYRSPGSGLWTNPDALKAVNIKGFKEDPTVFYKIFTGELYAPFAGALPNTGHLFMAEMEKTGRSTGVITQNIDGLHTKAGSVNVQELHGTMSSSSCMICKAQFATQSIFEKYIMDSETPECACGGVVRPDIVFFGEALPEKALETALKMCEDCSLMVVAGSSLSVMPAAMLPKHAKDHGAELVIINKTETPLDYMAEIVINKGIGEVFRELESLWKKVE